MKALEDYVTTVPDFPKKGIMFRDVTSILNDKDGFRLVIDELVKRLKDVDFDVVVGSESRGFIFGAPVAYALNKAFVLIRKEGKLPREKYSEDYELEYGTATIEMHEDAIASGQKVVVIDDLIATGGTARAAINLVERGGGKVVKVGFVMELAGLKGRDKLRGYDVFSLITYPGA